MNALKCGLVVAVLVAGVSSVYADLTDPPYYTFNDFRNHNNADTATGENQLFMSVTAYGTNQVLFWFWNTGPNPSSITHVYFDDGSLFALASVIDDGAPPTGPPWEGVYFSQDVDKPWNAPDLPGGQELNPPFVTNRYPAESGKKQKFDLWAEGADPPPVAFGVNPDEWLGVVFDLESGMTLDDTIANLGSGGLRVGIFVQGFAYGGSESFINNPVPIPAPGAALLGVLGLSLVGWVKRRLS